MGKMPFIETEHGYLSESGAILEYLEDIQPTPALYPVDPWARAKVSGSVPGSSEHYIELAGRRHYGHVFFQEGKNAAAVDEVRPVVENALAALQQLGSFKPYFCGSEFTIADIVRAQLVWLSEHGDEGDLRRLGHCERGPRPGGIPPGDQRARSHPKGGTRISRWRSRRSWPKQG